jgi:predicted short-subunit dehydrogenase-like oxidoreductase (DUF2520 family)
MRELDQAEPSSDTPACPRLAIVGQGRLGNALAEALAHGRYEIVGPLGRGADGADADVVLLCVPDNQIAEAAALIAPVPGRLVGHCSGATELDALAPHERFSLHPLMTVPEGIPSFAGAGAAIGGSTPRALELAAELAGALGMHPVEVADRDRAAYHAAASIASNFLVTLEAAAERVAGTAGVDRGLLVSLVLATVENWATLGPRRALTGPVARGDEATVAKQRAALEERAPDLLPLFDALAEATRALAREPEPPSEPPAPAPAEPDPARREDPEAEPQPA